MNKLIITLAVSALAICTFAQGIPQPKAVREADALAVVRGKGVGELVLRRNIHAAYFTTFSSQKPFPDVRL